MILIYDDFNSLAFLVCSSHCDSAVRLECGKWHQHRHYRDGVEPAKVSNLAQLRNIVSYSRATIKLHWRQALLLYENQNSLVFQ